MSDQGCSAYCEQNISMGYGKETHFTSSFCQATDLCTIATGTTITYTNQYTISASLDFGLKKRDVSNSTNLSKRDNVPVSATNIKASFNLGASYSYSTSIGYTTSETHVRDAKDTGCGYWTFIPYIME
jgi:hypothetical protein